MKNKISIKQTEETKSFEKEITYDDKKYLCYETYRDGKLAIQYFRPADFNHNGYEPSRMQFVYYGPKFDPLKEKSKYFESEWKGIKQKFVRKLDSFNDFENCYCIWFGMDGNIYRLTDPNPLPTFFHIELWETRFDLDKCRKVIENNPRVSKIELVDNCWANYDISGKHNLCFRYLVSDPEEIKEICEDSIMKDHTVAKTLGLDKFKKPEIF